MEGHKQAFEKLIQAIKTLLPPESSGVLEVKEDSTSSLCSYQVNSDNTIQRLSKSTQVAENKRTAAHALPEALVKVAQKKEVILMIKSFLAKEWVI